jgi:predicted amidohydrolase
MSKIMTVALVQVASFSANADLETRKREHWAKMAYYVEAISSLNPTVDLICFPELYVHGYDPVHWDAIAEPIPGPSAEFFCELAAEHGKWLVPGSLSEKREGVPGNLNTALLISPSGEIALRYSKVFVPYPLEGSTPGWDFPVYDMPGLAKLGLMICSDAHAPEVARNLVLNGAEILVKPTFQGHWIGGLRNHVPICQTRAVENQCFVLSVNQPTPLGMGHSCVCDPDGRVIEELEDSEAFLIVGIDLDQVRRAREQGFMGMFPFLKLLRDLKEQGRAIDACYLDGLERAPVFRSLSGEAPKTPDQLQRFRSD